MVESQPPNNPRSGISPLRGAFVGRQGELRKLKSALEDTTSGYGRLVMLAGEPGIGKTRTAQELAALAEARGAQVLWGRCYEKQVLLVPPSLQIFVDSAYVAIRSPKDCQAYTSTQEQEPGRKLYFDPSELWRFYEVAAIDGALPRCQNETRLRLMP